MSFISVSTVDPIARPLDEAELRARVPSLFAQDAHESRSARFAPIPTWDVVGGLQGVGWVVTKAQQQRTRDEGRRTHTKHLVRLRHRSSTAATLRGTFPELVLVNANDGAASYRLSGGLFRLVCLNGMVVGENVKKVVVPHRGAVRDRVIEGSFRVLEETTRLTEIIEPWRRIQLQTGEAMALAEAAHLLRFGQAQEDGSVQINTPVRPEQLLLARRVDDIGDDLWSTFNRVQENAIRGGLSAVGLDSNGRPRRATTREVRGIEQDVKLNAALFTLASRMADMVG